MLGRIVEARGDDWVVRFRCRCKGKTWQRWVGVSWNTDEKRALQMAIVTVNTPRRVASGFACEIELLDMCRMSQLGARKVVDGAPPQRVAEVAHWKGNAA